MPTVTNLTTLVAIPAGINASVVNAKQMTMLSLLGNPRSNYSSACQEIENPALAAKVVRADVGPFKVRGLGPAVDSLRTIMSDVAVEAPPVFAALGTAGMLCARLVRGSTTGISNHSWGTAIDLTLDSVLDQRGDGRVQAGLTLIAPIFNRHGWFWGAGFATEDAMHFEVGDGLIRQWHRDGLIGAGGAAPDPVLMLGDRGPEVTALQQRLRAGGIDVTVDGHFGPATRAAVVAFQSRNGLTADGAAGPRTRAALGM
jgi:hypothetical protein